MNPNQGRLSHVLLTLLGAMKNTRWIEHWCVLALACFAFVTAQQNQTEGPVKAADLQQDSLTNAENATAIPTTPTLIRLIYQSLSPARGAKGGDLNSIQEQKRRAEENREEAPNRTREEGCKVFYWKSWTAC